MQKELVDYIQTVVAKGFRPEQVKQALLQAGYSEETIQEAFANVQYNQPPVQSVKSGYWIFLMLILTVIIILLLGTLIFLLLDTRQVQESPTSQTPIKEPSACVERTPGQWCYSVSAEGITSEGCSDSEEKCISSYNADLAVARKDETLCNKVTDTQGKDLCYTNVASKRNNLEICNNIGDYQQKSGCIGMIAGQQKNKEICNTAASKDDCYAAYGMTSSDASVCELITDAGIKQTCEFLSTPPPPAPT